MPAIKFVRSKATGQLAAITGMEISSVLCPSLFRELTGLEKDASPAAVSTACHDRWTNLANVLGATPEPVEILLVVSGGGKREPGGTRGPGTGLFAVGRGPDEETAGGPAGFPTRR